MEKGELQFMNTMDLDLIFCCENSVFSTMLFMFDYLESTSSKKVLFGVLIETSTARAFIFAITCILMKWDGMKKHKLI